MKAKFLVYFLVFILSVAFVGNSYSQNKSYRLSKDTYTLPNDNNVKNSSRPVHMSIALDKGFTFGDAVIGPEQMTTLTGWYDYMTNGDNRHWILMDPADPQKLHVHYCVSDSANPSGSTSRRTVYAYSSDGGTTWTYGTEVPQGFRSGFGYMDLKTSDGAAVIANHNTRQPTLNTHLYVDAFSQLGSFTEYLTPATNGFVAWGHADVMSNGNIILIGESYVGGNASDTLKYAIFNGTTTTPWTYLDYTSATSNVRWATCAGANGNVLVVSDPVSEVTVLGANEIYGYRSTDNGATWGSRITLFTPFVNGGTDTIAPFFGLDAAFKPGTSDYYISFNTNGNSLFKKAQLWVAKNGGAPKLVADSSKVPNTRTMQSMAGITGIDHPSIGWSADGNVMYCAFSVMTADTGSRGWNTRDIYYCFSTDDGTTWSNAIQVTQTPAIDEGYCAISRVNPGNSPQTYVLHIVYMKDPGDGPTAFNGTNPTADPTRNWLIYRKITMPTVGVKNISTVASDYSLSQNYPNPFNPTTNIKFSIKKAGFVTLKVYDINGKEVSTLVNNKMEIGSYEYTLNASNLSSGVYFYTIKANGYTETKKMMLIK